MRIKMGSLFRNSIVLIAIGLRLMYAQELFTDEIREWDDAIINAKFYQNDSLSHFPVVHRINCGGTRPILDGSGHTWSADYGFGDSSSIHREHGGLQTEDQDMSVEADFFIYEQQRYATRVQRSLSYQLPVPWPANYIVVLRFAETCTCAQKEGERIFEIMMEDKRIDTLDVTKAVGFKTPLVKQYKVRIEDGSFTLELLGIVRNPILSAIEILGPVSYALSDPDGFRTQTSTIINMPVIEPPEAVVLYTEAANFALEFVSTGTRHRDDLRFSTAFDPDYRLFRMDIFPEAFEGVADAEAHAIKLKADLERDCTEKCAHDTTCGGVFYRVMENSLYCIGLSQVGRAVGTYTVSKSWAKVGFVSDKSFLGKMSSVNIAAVLEEELTKNNLPQHLYHIPIFEGHTPQNQAGPWLVASTAEQKQHHLFVFELSPVQCINRCVQHSTCIAIVLSAEKVVNGENPLLRCTGLDSLGTKAGVETDENSMTYLVGVDSDNLPEIDEMPQTSRKPSLTNSTVQDSNGESGPELQVKVGSGNKKGGKGGLIAGCIVGLLLVLAVIGIARVAYNRRNGPLKSGRMQLMQSRLKNNPSWDYGGGIDLRPKGIVTNAVQEVAFWLNPETSPPPPSLTAAATLTKEEQKKASKEAKARKKSGSKTPSRSSSSDSDNDPRNWIAQELKKKKKERKQLPAPPRRISVTSPDGTEIEIQMERRRGGMLITPPVSPVPPNPSQSDSSTPSRGNTVSPVVEEEDQSSTLDFITRALNPPRELTNTESEA
eukprot:m.44951 g.44951  ORF g.44951 m.44951 type:complete len:771 (-) comp10165_c0_seq2:92-2404(-)